MGGMKLLTVPEVARAIGVPTAWLRTLVRAGTLPSLRAGRRVLLERSAVEAALAALAQSPTNRGRRTP